MISPPFTPSPNRRGAEKPGDTMPPAEKPGDTMPPGGLDDALHSVPHRGIAASSSASASTPSSTNSSTSFYSAHAHGHTSGNDPLSSFRHAGAAAVSVTDTDTAAAAARVRARRQIVEAAAAEAALAAASARESARLGRAKAVVKRTGGLASAVNAFAGVGAKASAAAPGPGPSAAETNAEPSTPPRWAPSAKPRQPAAAAALPSDAIILRRYYTQHPEGIASAQEWGAESWGHEEWAQKVGKIMGNYRRKAAKKAERSGAEEEDWTAMMYADFVQQKGVDLRQWAAQQAAARETPPATRKPPPTAVRARDPSPATAWPPSSDAGQKTSRIRSVVSSINATRSFPRPSARTPGSMAPTTSPPSVLSLSPTTSPPSADRRRPKLPGSGLAPTTTCVSTASTTGATTSRASTTPPPSAATPKPKHRPVDPWKTHSSLRDEFRELEEAMSVGSVASSKSGINPAKVAAAKAASAEQAKARRAAFLSARAGAKLAPRGRVSPRALLDAAATAPSPAPDDRAAPPPVPRSERHHVFDAPEEGDKPPPIARSERHHLFDDAEGGDKHVDDALAGDADDGPRVDEWVHSSPQPRAPRNGSDASVSSQTLLADIQAALDEADSQKNDELSHRRRLGAHQAFVRADANRDGVVTLVEFREWFSTELLTVELDNGDENADVMETWRQRFDAMLTEAPAIGSRGAVGVALEGFSMLRAKRLDELREQLCHAQLALGQGQLRSAALQNFAARVRTSHGIGWQASPLPGDACHPRSVSSEEMSPTRSSAAGALLDVSSSAEQVQQALSQISRLQLTAQKLQIQNENLMETMRFLTDLAVSPGRSEESGASAAAADPSRLSEMQHKMHITEHLSACAAPSPSLSAHMVEHARRVIAMGMECPRTWTVPPPWNISVTLEQKSPWGVVMETDAAGRLFVSELEKDGIAERAGMRVGFVVHSVGGKSVLESRKALRALRRKPPLVVELCSPDAAEELQAAAEASALLKQWDAPESTQEHLQRGLQRKLRRADSSPKLRANEPVVVIVEHDGPLDITLFSDNDLQASVRCESCGPESSEQGLREGMHVLSVQGRDCSHSPLQEVGRLIREAPRPLRLEFEELAPESSQQESEPEPEPEASPNAERSKTVVFGQEGSLGLVLGSDDPLDQIWLAVDADGDGSLDREEISSVLRLMGRKQSATEVDRVMRELDVDHDGDIDIGEFEDWYADQPDRTVVGGTKAPVRIESVGAYAAKRGLRPGLKILSVQGQNVRDEPLREVTRAIKEAGRPLTLVFELPDAPKAVPKAANAIPSTTVVFGKDVSLDLVLGSDDPLDRMWLEVDADGDGNLGRDEVIHVLKLMGRKTSGVDKVMRELDADLSGDIDIGEFEDWYQRQEDRKVMGGTKAPVRIVSAPA